ncbi:uncharacterized protein LOC143367960 [Andrena cerasifolii]|uniref:uncharacterized protein LOC143367960 n=1 Tax=Andrena cerasifolii TaxID=2819439 RepID=UPI004037EE1C
MPPSVEERIKTLKLRREAFKLELENFRLLIEGYESGMSGSEIKVQYNEIETEYAIFCKTQIDLDAADETGDYMRERVSIKSMFGTCKARALDILERVKSVAQSLATLEVRGAVGVETPISRASPQSHTESIDSDIYLPKINLPVFAGVYEEWPGFSDQFRSSIQENPKINDCKKLMYLRSCLKDEAAKTIESVGNSANNYTVAWGLLEKRYNQPAVIVANHIKALFDTSPVLKSSYSELRVFVNRVEAHYRSLKSLEQLTVDTLLIHLLTSKLDNETVLKWKEQNKSTPFPMMDELFLFLHDRCKVIEPVGSPETSVAKEVSQPLPQDVIYREALEIPAGIHLADPTFHLPGEIDGIIGGEYFWDLMSVGRIALKDPNAKLQKTLLGWIVVGKYLENQEIRPVNCHLTFETLHADISKFWNLEECPSGKICSPEEQACEEHYASHTSRDSMSGRYTVSLPFNDNKDKLGETYHMAMKRYLSLERSLNRNLDRKSQYVAFLREYEQLNHMTEIVDDVNAGCYLPHHPVIKTDSVTTKIRVVFDASAQSSSGVTLNSTLMVGPTIQQDLVSLVTRFRVHKYVLTADIAKMYRQVDLNVADRKYHKILWRENITNPIKTYQLNTVTYGTASAPFLAVRTLHQLAHDEGKTHPVAAKVLLNDFYIDDVLTGAQSFDEALLLRDDLISITAKGGFQLRQWLSNESQCHRWQENFGVVLESQAR